MDQAYLIGEVGFCRLSEILALMARIYDLESIDDLPEEILEEIYDVVNGLVATAFAEDGQLTLAESQFLNGLHELNSSLEENQTEIVQALQKWQSIQYSTPKFFQKLFQQEKHQLRFPHKWRFCSELQVIFELACAVGGKSPIQEESAFTDFKNRLDAYTDEICEREKSGTSGLSQAPASKPPVVYSSAPLNQSRTGSNPPPITAANPSANEKLEQAISELERLTGLKGVKEEVNGQVNLIRVRTLRSQQGLQLPPLSLHLVFTGNPGTGKTTVARLIAQIFHGLGLLSKGHLVEIDRSGMVAGYVGQTALKVQSVVKRALGGVLFIDEAYALVSEDEDDYGKEAIDTLLKLMEDNRENLVVIVAGYTVPMQNFLNSNPGLRSRFNKFIHFEDYNPQELYDIFMRFCVQGGYTYDAACAQHIFAALNRLYVSRGDNFGNGRTVRNFFEQTLTRHANRLAQNFHPTKEDLMTLTPEDLPTADEFN